VSNLSGVTALVGGRYHSAAVRSDGTVWTWGDNSYGGLGINSSGGTIGSTVPVQVVDVTGTGSLTGITAVAGGGYFTLALKSDGTLYGFGRDDLGQLGNNSSTSITRPVRVSGPGGIGLLSGIVAISAGNDHSVALRNDGTVWTWGNNANGELGANSTAASSLTPVQVVRADGTALSGVTGIAAGGYHTLAVTSDGSVYAWGKNDWGQLGNNSTVTSGVAVQVLAPGGGSVLSGAAGVGAGLVHSLVLKRDGGVMAWGFGGYGQLGTGNQASPILPVTVVASPGVPLTGMAAVVGGGMHSVSLGTDGGVRTWGRNGEGELGNGTTTNSSLPVTPTGVSGMTSIGAGHYHTLSTVAIQRQQTTTYGYDRLSRLTTSTNPSGTTSYDYDPVGNRQSVTQGGGKTSNVIARGGVQTAPYDVATGEGLVSE